MVAHGWALWAVVSALATGTLSKPIGASEEHFRDEAQHGPTTITAPDGQVLVYDNDEIVIGATATVSLATITSSEFVTHGVTFTLSPGETPKVEPVALDRRQRPGKPSDPWGPIPNPPQNPPPQNPPPDSPPPGEPESPKPPGKPSDPWGPIPNPPQNPPDNPPPDNPEHPKPPGKPSDPWGPIPNPPQNPPPDNPENPNPPGKPSDPWGPIPNPPQNPPPDNPQNPHGPEEPDNPQEPDNPEEPDDPQEPDEPGDGNDDDGDDDDEDEDEDDDDDGGPVVPIPPPPPGTPPKPPNPGNPKPNPNPGNPKPNPPPKPDDPSPEDPPEEEPEDPSCTKTIEAPWESVRCTVTGTKTKTPKCTTETLTATATCTTPAATDVTTTTTVGVAKPTFACSPKSCGGGSCGNSQKRSEAELAKREIVPRDPEPEKCQWAGPSNYNGDSTLFMSSESGLGDLFSNHNGEDKGVRAVALDRSGGTTSSKVAFEALPVSLATPRLIGCTSVILVSRRGAWANHIWEIPTFLPEEAWLSDEKELEEGEEDRKTGWYLPGGGGKVEEFPAEQQRQYFQREAIDPMLEEIKGMTGEGQRFNSIEWPMVYVFAPLVRLQEDGDSAADLPFMWDRHSHTEGHDPRPDTDKPYNDVIMGALRETLKDHVSESDFEMIPYAPLSDDTDKDIFDEGYNDVEGRAMVQYQPGLEAEEFPRPIWRIWFEAQQTPHYEHSWEPVDHIGDRGQMCG